MTTMTKKANRPQEFRGLATTIAKSLLTEWVGEERAREATGRIAAALSSSAAAAKKPEDFYECTPQSVATCIAIAALTGIMPGTGASALAYLIPRSPRRGEKKQLGYMHSHRGLNALASRCGKVMIPIPISHNDTLRVSDDGDVIVTERDLDNPPMTAEELRGVVVIVKDVERGHTITRSWMPWKLIEVRRQQSDSYRFAMHDENKWARDSDPWHKWPVEMAMKTAMHYAISRGWCVIDDTEAVRALSVDASNDVIEGRVVEPNSAKAYVENLEAVAGHIEAEPQDEAPIATDDQKLSEFHERLSQCTTQKACIDLEQAYDFASDDAQAQASAWVAEQRERIKTGMK